MLVPSLSELLIKEQEKDHKKCLDYYKKLKLNEGNFSADNTALFRRVHGFAFSLGLWLSKVEEDKNPANIYLYEIRSDAIQLLPAIVLGNRRSLRLYERAHIEDILRYIFYHDHPIEHQLLQLEPKSYANLDVLFSWVKRHPLFRSDLGSLEPCLDFLHSTYAELSRSVHTTTNNELELSSAVTLLHSPIEAATLELVKLQTIFESVTFLLSRFQKEIYLRFDLNERALVSQFLSKSQKKVLAGLKQ